MMTALWVFLGVLAGVVIGAAAGYFLLLRSISKSIWR